MSCIYKITNDVNGKMYIGKTSYNIEKRWGEHCRATRNPNRWHFPLYRAMRKYGIEHFTITQLEECEEDKASERECFWIEKLGTYKNGYNATLGGDGGHIIDYDRVLEEYERIKSVKVVAEKMGISSKTVSTILHTHGIPTEYRNGVEMIDTNGEHVATFESISDAAEYVVWFSGEGKKENMRKGISRSYDRPGKIAYGFIWRSIS